MLHKYLVRIGLCKRSHVLQIPHGEASSFGECSPEIFGELVDYFASPRLAFLSIEDSATNLPVEED